MPPVRIREHKRAKKGTLPRLLKELFKRYPLRLGFAIFLILFNVFANLSSSMFLNFVTVCLTKAAYGLTPSNPFVGSYEVTAMGMTFSTNVSILLCILAAIYAFGIFAAWWWRRSMAIITHEFLNELRIKMFTHLQDLPIKYFDTHPHGEIMSLFTNDIDTIRQFISGALPTFIQASAAITLVLVVMMMNSIWMTIVTIVCSILMCLPLTRHLNTIA